MLWVAVFAARERGLHHLSGAYSKPSEERNEDRYYDAVDYSG